MNEPSPSHSLLQEIDARQNELLMQLDELNARVEQAIHTWSSLRAPQEIGDAA